jgi:hypothetical protein
MFLIVSKCASFYLFLFFFFFPCCWYKIQWKYLVLRVLDMSIHATPHSSKLG